MIFLYIVVIVIKKNFFLFSCDLNYKQKHIDELTNKIFEILDNSAFEGQELKKESSNKINALFEEYKTMNPNIGKINQLTEIRNISNSSVSSINDSNSSSSGNVKKSKKRIDSRMIVPNIKKEKSGTVSVDIDDITSMKENDTDLSIMFKQNFDQDFYEPQINKWRNIKIVDVVLCSIFCIIMTIFVILLWILK